MTLASKAPCPMCGGPRDSEIYVCPKCKYAPLSFSIQKITQNQVDTEKIDEMIDILKDMHRTLIYMADHMDEIE